jgi:hypothetical protein
VGEEPRKSRRNRLPTGPTVRQLGSVYQQLLPSSFNQLSVHGQSSIIRLPPRLQTFLRLNVVAELRVVSHPWTVLEVW